MWIQHEIFKSKLIQKCKLGFYKLFKNKILCKRTNIKQKYQQTNVQPIVPSYPGMPARPGK